jgi:hypothetical protein
MPAGAQAKSCCKDQQGASSSDSCSSWDLTDRYRNGMHAQASKECETHVNSQTSHGPLAKRNPVRGIGR